jgi:hypothetical protein
LLSALQTFTPHVLVLSTSFLPAFPKIRPMLRRTRTALLLLAEDHNCILYTRWLRAQGMEGPLIVDAMRRVARAKLFVQDRSSDT